MGTIQLCQESLLFCTFTSGYFSIKVPCALWAPRSDRVCWLWGCFYKCLKAPLWWYMKVTYGGGCHGQTVDYYEQVASPPLWWPAARPPVNLWSLLLGLLLTLTLTGLTQLHWKNAIFILPTKTFLVIRDGTLVIKAPLALYIYWIYIWKAVVFL